MTTTTLEAAMIAAHRLGCGYARELTASARGAEAKASALYPDNPACREAFVAGYLGTLRRMTLAAEHKEKH